MALHQFIKRSLEIIFCLVLLPVSLAIGICIALAILLDTGRPIFFSQRRVGWKGRSFRLYKFRTLTSIDSVPDSEREYMRSYVRGELNADEDFIFQPYDDSRATRLGRFLRDSGLDELPQLWNVLRGEMSLVGPRPHVPWEVDEYLDHHHRRHEVRPGITGLAQVRGRSNIPFERAVRYDLDYIDNRSVWLDLQIVFETLGQALGANRDSDRRDETDGVVGAQVSSSREN